MGALIFFVLSAMVSVCIVENVSGHGMLWDPPNRSSMWRLFPSAPPNYDDDQNFCGGRSVQYDINHGKCGPCGDDYRDPIPRPNENTGTYGRGLIGKRYESGSVITVRVNLTTNHKGWFDYSLCVLKESNEPENEECFWPLLLENGSQRFEIDASNVFENRVRLPEDLKCERCVLRWNYRVANSWGLCPNGTGALGCGDQETFRSCSDIEVY